MITWVPGRNRLTVSMYAPSGEQLRISPLAGAEALPEAIGMQVTSATAGNRVQTLR